MKTIRDYFNYLIANYSHKLAKSDVYEIFEEILKKSYVELVLDLDYVLNQEEIDKLENAINLLNSDYPVPYITKRKYFYKNFFYVNENVLIPRDDTEILVENVLNFLKNEYTDFKPVIYDICTGSGAIGLSVKQENPFSDIYLSDISYEALKVVKENSILLNVKDINLVEGDFLKPFLKNKNIPKANLIMSNPPYIKIGDKNVEKSVHLYEPSVALYAKDDGLEFYKTIAKNMYKLIDETKKFMIIMEFGFEQKEEIEKIFKEKVKINNKIEFIKDNSHNWRIIKIYN